MKKLILMRHALPEGGTAGLRDKDRGLTPEGQNQCRHARQYIVKNDLVPDLVLCSSATRTRQTFAHMNIPVERIEYQDTLYLPTREKIIQAIHDVFDPGIETLMVITHYPGVVDFAAHISGSDAFDHGYPEGGISIFNCGIKDWQNLSPSSIDLEVFQVF